MNRLSNVLVGIVFFLVVAGGLGWTAPAPAQTPAATTASSDLTLEEVIVTAQRRSERVQDVPIAVTAMSGTELEDRGVRQAGDIAALVPNLELSLPYGEEAQPTFALRGVTTNDWSQNQSSPIAMYVDDVYKPVGAVQALQTYDLDRVEVLRGPQGTLYGKNATGGAMNFYTRNPSLTAYDGYLTAGISNFNGRQVEGAVGGPISDGTLAWRVAGVYDKRDGWMNSVVPGVQPLNGVDAYGGRLTLLWKPSSAFDLLFKLGSTHSGGTPYGAKALNVDPAVVGTDGNYGGWWNGGAKYAIDKKLDHTNGVLKIDWQFSEHYTLTAVSGYDYGNWYERSDDGALWKADTGDVLHIDDPNLYSSSINAWSQEVRIASHDTGAFGWLAGGYYGHDSTHYVEQFHFFDSTFQGFYAPQQPLLWGFDEYNNFDQDRTSKALFFNANYDVAPNVKLRGGVRYTKDDITIRNFYALLGGMTNRPIVNGPDSYPIVWTQTIPYVTNIAFEVWSAPDSLAPPAGLVPNFSHDTSNTSAMAGVDWKIASDVLGYFTFSQGYRGAAFNGQAFNNDSELTFANPETLNAYEVGIKSELLDRRLQLNGAVFYYDYKNQQFLDTYCAYPDFYGPDTCGGAGFKLVNAPKSKVYGGEIEMHAKVTADLDVQANLGLLHSEYTELYLRGANRSGNHLIMAPDVSAGLVVDWRAARFAIGDLHLEVDGNYYSRQYFDAMNTERISQGNYEVYNARVSLLATGDNHLSFALWGKNLGDEQYLSYGLAQRNPSDGGLGFDYTLVGEPRTYGLEVTVRY